MPIKMRVFAASLILLVISLASSTFAQTGSGSPADRERQFMDLSAVEPGFALLLDGQAKSAYFFFEDYLAKNPASEAARVGMIQAGLSFPDLWPECKARFPPEPDAASIEDLIGNLEVALLTPKSEWPIIEQPQQPSTQTSPRGAMPSRPPPGEETERNSGFGPFSWQPGQRPNFGPNRGFRSRFNPAQRAQVSPAEAVLARLEQIAPDNIWTLFGRARLDMIRSGNNGKTNLRVQVRNRWTLRLRERAENWDYPGMAVQTMKPLLVPARGALLFWNYYLMELSNGRGPMIQEAISAAYAHPSSPLAPKVIYESAFWIDEPNKRWELLSEIASLYPQSVFWDSIQFDRAYMLHNSRPEEALEILDQIVARESSSVLRRAHDLAGDLELKTGHPQRALEHYLTIEKGWNTPMNLAVGKCQGMLGNWAQAESRFRAELDRLATEKSLNALSRRIDAHVLLADAIANQGRYQEALDLYDQAPFFVASFPEPARPSLPRLHFRPAYIRTLLHVFGFPIMAGILLVLLTLTASMLAVVVWLDRIREIRPFLPAGVFLAFTVSFLQTFYSIEFSDIGNPALIAYISSVFLRNLLLVGAGAWLFSQSGFKLNAWLQRTTRSPWALLAWVGEIVLTLALMAGWTILLYQVQTPELGAFFLRMADLYRGSEFTILLNHQENLPAACTLVSVAAINEEILFRTFLQGSLLTAFLSGAPYPSKKRFIAPFAAIAITSLLWALPHAGMVQPEWWKMLQVSGLGMILGLLAFRRGPAATIVAHVTFNLASVILST
jgi:membrane protease YdiL (CAAX protease family)/tetratricopeptide (TPR) repeat protein